MPDTTQPQNTPAPVTADKPAAPATPAETAPQMNAEGAALAERRRARAIMQAARPHVASGAIDEAFVDTLIDEGASLAMASERILAALADAQPQIAMHAPVARSRIMRDERQTRREGLSMALTARLTGEGAGDERARPYAQMAIHEMAAASIGAPAPGFGTHASREQIIMSAMQSGSDFPNILSNSVNRVLEQNFDLVGRTFTAVSREMEFNDFREHSVVRPDEFPTLQQVGETGEIKFGSIGDNGETLALAAYATGLSISRQALVDDDLGAIQTVLDNAAAIVPEFEENLFWTMFLANPSLADGKAVFSAAHGNLAETAAAISTDALSAGRQALRSMKAADGARTILMNAPSILLVGPENETAAEQYLAQNVQPTLASEVNPFAGKLRPVVTEMITDSSWYLLVDPAKRTHSFKHGYLRGQKVPRIRIDEPFGTQGVRMTLEHDFGAGAVNYRGAYKNAGV